MSLESELGIDFNAIDLKTAEAEMASGGLVAEGYHHAVLEGVRSGTANSGTPFREFTFKILAGPFRGAEVEHTLYLPHSGQDEGKKKKSTNQLAIYAHRLGLKKKVPTADGKETLVPIEGKHDFADCLGAACVIDVKHEMDRWKDSTTGLPREMKKAKLTFEGVLEVTDKRVVEKKVPMASTVPAVAPQQSPAAKYANI